MDPQDQEIGDTRSIMKTTMKNTGLTQRRVNMVLSFIGRKQKKMLKLWTSSSTKRHCGMDAWGVRMTKSEELDAVKTQIN